MEHDRMKKIGLVTGVAILILLAGVALASCMEAQRLGGRLYLIKSNNAGTTGASLVAGEQDFRLSLDNPLVFAQGSKSERVVKDIGLIVSAGLREKALKLEGRPVVVEGPLDCTMHYSPWTASCDMTVRQIDERTLSDKLPD
jgi:hypothetical protein